MKKLVNKIINKSLFFLQYIILGLYNIFIPWVMMMFILCGGIYKNNLISLIMSIVLFIIFAYIVIINLWLEDTYKWDYIEQKEIDFKVVRILLKDKTVCEKYIKIKRELEFNETLEKITKKKH